MANQSEGSRAVECLMELFGEDQHGQGKLKHAWLGISTSVSCATQICLPVISTESDIVLTS